MRIPIMFCCPVCDTEFTIYNNTICAFCPNCSLLLTLKVVASAISTLEYMEYLK